MTESTHRPEETQPWRRWVAIGLIVLVVITVVLFNDRIADDFWPLDRSVVGPNILASVVQWVVVFIAAVIFYPPLRRAVHRFFDRKLDGIHEKLDDLHGQHHKTRQQMEDHDSVLDELRESLDRLHKKIGGE